MRTVVVYRELILRSSETFIAAQAYALSRYRPVFAGLAWEPNALIARSDAIIAYRGASVALQRAVHRRLRTTPGTFVRKLQAHQPAMFHTHFGIDAVSAVPVANALGVPHLITFHGYDATLTDAALAAGPFVQRRFLKQRHALIRANASFIAVSHFIRNQLLAKGFPAERTRVHYTGIDTRLFREDERSFRGPNILFVARLVPKKGVECLIEAARTLQNEYPNLRVTVVGSGPQEWLLREAAESVTALRVLGFQGPDEIRQHIREAKVFCVPSVVAADGDAEGFGMVFAEAQAMGVPVVSFRSGGIPEAVVHGSTGLLAAEGDVRELIQHLRTVLDFDADSWSQFSGRAVEHVRRSFDVVRQSEELERIYDSMCQHASNSGQ